MTEGAWRRITPHLSERLTGRWRARRGWWTAILQVEVEQRQYRPICSGHTPANWQAALIWRDVQVDCRHSSAFRIQWFA